MLRFRFDSIVRFSLAFLLVGAMAGCNDDPSDPGPGPDPDPDPDPDPIPAEVLSATIVDTAGPIFRSIVIELDSAAMVQVFYGPPSGQGVLMMQADSMADSHDILLPRLRAETQYQVAIRTYTDSATSDSIYRMGFSTEALPLELSQFEYSVSGHSSLPLLMVPFRSTTLGWAGQVAITSDGAIVWYLESAGGTLVAAPVPGTHDMVFIENGFPGDAGRNGIVRVSPEREIVSELVRNPGVFGQIHHDMTAVDGERVFFLAYDTMTVRDTLVNGEAVWEWNMTTGAVTKRWSAWDFFDWDTDRGAGSTPQGWFHANSISIGPRGNIVISSRSLSQVFSIAPDFESIEYRIGGINATVALSDEDRFSGQHSASELPGNRLLLFDNRGAPADSSSRALELQLDGDTAYAVWQHDPEPSIFSPLRGGVYRLDNGNTVTIFASLPFEVHEVTPDGEVLWTFTGDPTFTTTFRAIPWPSIAGEVEVEAMP